MICNAVTLMLSFKTDLKYVILSSFGLLINGIFNNVPFSMPFKQRKYLIFILFWNIILLMVLFLEPLPRLPLDPLPSKSVGLQRNILKATDFIQTNDTRKYRLLVNDYYPLELLNKYIVKLVPIDSVKNCYELDDKRLFSAPKELKQFEPESLQYECNIADIFAENNIFTTDATVYPMTAYFKQKFTIVKLQLVSLVLTKFDSYWQHNIPMSYQKGIVYDFQNHQLKASETGKNALLSIFSTKTKEDWIHKSYSQDIETVIDKNLYKYLGKQSSNGIFVANDSSNSANDWSFRLFVHNFSNEQQIWDTETQFREWINEHVSQALDFLLHL